MTKQFSRLNSVLSDEQTSFFATAISSQTTAPESYILAECVSVTVENKEVCLNLPLGLGRKCVEVPDWVPNGEAARACISIKKKWGVPVGINLCVYVADREAACAYFGL